MNLRQFAVLLIMLVSFDAMAQKPISGKTTFTIKSMGPQKSSLEVGLNLANSSESTVKISHVRYRYFLTKDLAVRINYLDNTNRLFEYVYQTPSGFNGLEGTRETIERIWNFQPGFEYHLPGTKRLSPYFGAYFGLGGGKKEINRIDFNDLDPTEIVFEKNFSRGEEAPSFNFGFGALAGTDFYVSENFYMGTELSWDYLQVISKQGTFFVSSDDDPTLNQSGNFRAKRRNVSTGFNAVPTVRVGWRF